MPVIDEDLTLSELAGDAIASKGGGQLLEHDRTVRICRAAASHHGEPLMPEEAVATLMRSAASSSIEMQVVGGVSEPPERPSIKVLVMRA